MIRVKNSRDLILSLRGTVNVIAFRASFTLRFIHFITRIVGNQLEWLVDCRWGWIGGEIYSFLYPSNGERELEAVVKDYQNNIHFFMNEPW